VRRSHVDHNTTGASAKPIPKLRAKELNKLDWMCPNTWPLCPQSIHPQGGGGVVVPLRVRGLCDGFEADGDCEAAFRAIARLHGAGHALDIAARDPQPQSVMLIGERHAIAA